MSTYKMVMVYQYSYVQLLPTTYISVKLKLSLLKNTEFKIKLSITWIGLRIHPFLPESIACLASPDP